MIVRVQSESRKASTIPTRHERQTSFERKLATCVQISRYYKSMLMAHRLFSGAAASYVLSSWPFRTQTTRMSQSRSSCYIVIPQVSRGVRCMSANVETSEPREAMEYDVCIIGAGPAGLSAAIRLKQVCTVSDCLLQSHVKTTAQW